MSDEDLSNHIKQHIATIEKVSTPGFKERLTFRRDKGKQEVVKALRANQYLMEQEVKNRKYNMKKIFHGKIEIISHYIEDWGEFSDKIFMTFIF